MDVDICNLLRQAYLEQEDRISAADLDFRFRLPEKKIILSLDSQKTYRIFDNLYTNIIKYALKGTRVYVTLTEEKESSSEGNLSPGFLRKESGICTDRAEKHFCIGAVR